MKDAHSKTFKIAYIAFVVIILISISSIAWWLYGASRGFNRSFDLEGMVIFILTILPLAFVVLIAMIYVIWNRCKSKRTLSFPLMSLFVIAMVTLSAVITFHPSIMPGPVQDSIHSDILRPTDDGLFQYRFELVNPFQRNATARLFIRDLETEEEMLIYLDVFARDIHGFSSLGDNRGFLWARMEQGEQEGQYILRVPAGVPYRTIKIGRSTFRFAGIEGIRGRFLIDIPAGTSTRISYRSVN